MYDLTLFTKQQYFDTTTIVRFFSFLNDCREELSPDSETSACEALARSLTFPSLFIFSVEKTDRFRVVTFMPL
jgi:hypothetical protein